MALTDFLTQIADAIRSKDGTSDVIKATDFPQRILNIPSGGSSEIEYHPLSFTEDSESIIIPTNKKCKDVYTIISVPVNAIPLAQSGSQYIAIAEFFPNGRNLSTSGTYYALGVYNNWVRPSAYSKKDSTVCSDSDTGILINALFAKGDYIFLII